MLKPLRMDESTTVVGGGSQIGFTGFAFMTGGQAVFGDSSHPIGRL
jgi:hypothetical protein